MPLRPITVGDAILIVLHDRPDRTAATTHISEQIFLRARRDLAFFEVVMRWIH